MPEPPANARPHLAVSPWLIGGILLTIVALTWVFTPSPRDLLARQLKDGASVRALDTLRGMGAWDRRGSAEHYALLELRLGRELLNAKDAPAVHAQLRHAFRLADKFKFTEPFLKELRLLVQVAPDTAMVRDALQPHESRMSAAARRAVQDALVAKALALADPAQAAALFTAHWRTAPDEPNTAEMVRLWRAAGRPADALAAIEAFPVPRGGKLAQVSPSLARRRIELLRETAQPGRALDATLELHAVAPPAMQAELFELLVTTARESNRAADVLDAVRQRAQVARTDAALWRMLGELAISAGRGAVAVEAGERLVVLAPEDRALRFKLGQLLEWNAMPSRAFDEYRTALKLGEPEAVSRLLALNPGLYRDADLAEALTGVGAMLDFEKHGLFLARLLGSIGRYDEAVKAYENLLLKRPSNTALLKELGRLLLDLAEYEKALAIYARLETASGGDITSGKAIAELLFRLGRYPESFDRYLKLWQQSPEDSTLESCITLAESLGKLHLIPAMLQQRIARTKKVQPDDYRRLAHYQMLLGETTAVRESLRVAVGRFPDDGELRMQLAYALAGAKQPLEAARVLERHSQLRKQPELVNLYASLLLDAERRDEAVALLASLDPSLAKHPGLAATRLRIEQTTPPPPPPVVVEATPPPPVFVETDPAKLHAADPRNPEHALAFAWQLFNKRRFAQAERVLKPFLASRPSPAMASLAAQLAAAREDFPLAAHWQRHYLASKPADSGPAWTFLGDIYSSLGERDKARAAWERGLKETLGGIARGKGK